MEKEIYLAGGCFWGVEHFIGALPGVLHTTVGYANSLLPEPTYQQVCSGVTDAAETVMVVYDPSEIALEDILQWYFRIIDPFAVDRQGHDEGHQYRTGIYTVDDDSAARVARFLELRQREYDRKLAVETMPLVNFYPAEEYHQDYLVKNPGGYCHISPETMALVRTHRR